MKFELSLKETVEKYGLMAKKALGQNFLLDQNITDKIIRESLLLQGLEDLSGRNVLEIGPGPGGLTRAVLQKQPATVSVIEMDERCVAIMEDLAKESQIQMSIFNADALSFEPTFENDRPIQIVSNLPYNISVPLLTRWLKKMPTYEAMTLMFQKEVADRIMAPVKTKSYGRLSVLAQLICQINRLAELNPECFVPAPKIRSTVLLFRPLKHIPTADILEKIEMLTTLAFGQRRKMIRQSLKSVKNLEKICADLNIPLTARAEELTPTDYAHLAQNL
jgi:16S rRNA (adenine1518-N6/adenine1519-N6)-dimethyltransferase